MLLLEDMSPAEQGDQIAGCTLEQAHAAVVNLAGLHGPRWCDESLHAHRRVGAVRRRKRPEGMGIAFGMIVEPFIERYGTPDHDADVLRVFAPHVACWMLGRSDRFGLVHGDYRLDNLMFATEAGGPPCTAVDWQLVAVGLPARVTSGSSSAPACRTTSAPGTSVPSLARTMTCSSRTVSARTHRNSVGTTTGIGLFQGPLITVLGAMQDPYRAR